MTQAAILALEDGTVFEGISIGTLGYAVGEVVFNTAMTGYQEILTDPSYAEQIITFTYPHIGNTGINEEDHESNQVWAKGLVIRDASLIASNYRQRQSLSEFLKRQKIVAIADIDTRQLTQHLRLHGSLKGCIYTPSQRVSFTHEQAIAQAQQFAGLSGVDLAQQVTTTKAYPWQQGSWQPGKGYSVLPKSCDFTVVVYDFGVKRNILRLLVDRGCHVHVVSAKTPVADILALQPDGVLLSNGPGDPQACDYAIRHTQELLLHNVPIFGICLGYQILGLACGAQTFKMKFGHHGANHPIQDQKNQKVYITSQNHGFALDDRTLPDELSVCYRSLFDGTLQGIEHRDHPAFGVQGHPEANPGPKEWEHVFDHFMTLMSKAKTVAE